MPPMMQQRGGPARRYDDFSGVLDEDLSGDSKGRITTSIERPTPGAMMCAVDHHPRSEFPGRFSRATRPLWCCIT
jgi:hypothetical protein